MLIIYFFLSKAMMFSFHREWAVTVCWAPQLFLMLVGCVKETTPPARSTKDSTPSSTILTVGHSNQVVLLMLLKLFQKLQVCFSIPDTETDFSYLSLFYTPDTKKTILSGLVS